MEGRSGGSNPPIDPFNHSPNPIETAKGRRPSTDSHLRGLDHAVEELGVWNPAPGTRHPTPGIRNPESGPLCAYSETYEHIIYVFTSQFDSPMIALCPPPLCFALKDLLAISLASTAQYAGVGGKVGYGDGDGEGEGDGDGCEDRSWSGVGSGCFSISVKHLNASCPLLSHLQSW